MNLVWTKGLMGWQPIATAPTTEQDVLLWDGRVAIGYFSNFSGRWLSRDEHLFNDRPKQLEPTHWMPLPVPPWIEAEDGK